MHSRDYDKAWLDELLADYLLYTSPTPKPVAAALQSHPVQPYAFGMRYATASGCTVAHASHAQPAQAANAGPVGVYPPRRQHPPTRPAGVRPLLPYPGAQSRQYKNLQHLARQPGKATDYSALEQRIIAMLAEKDAQFLAMLADEHKTVQWEKDMRAWLYGTSEGKE